MCMWNVYIYVKDFTILQLHLHTNIHMYEYIPKLHTYIVTIKIDE